MNAYFDNTGYRSNISKGNVSGKRYGDRLISFVCAIVSLLTCTAAIVIERIFVSVLLLVAFFGVAGGIEGGSLSWFAGFLICAVIALAEYALLKSIVKAAAK